jgi:transcriptional regulator with XRE-family HTH domain
VNGATIARIPCGANILCGERQVLLAYPVRVGHTSVSGDDMLIGARIRKARERLGVSITDLGLAYGKNRQTVQFWENGKHFPPLSDFNRLCRLLRTDANQLLGFGDMAVITEQEAVQARLEIETLAHQERSRREEAERPRPARGRLQRASGNTGRFRRPA